MDRENQRPFSERERTNESLRLERDKADHALDKTLAAIDETADAVIVRARSRADEVLAASRARADQHSAPLADRAHSARIVGSERALEDQAVREQRADADEVLSRERAEHVGLLSIERKETDKDLLSERSRSDYAVATRDEFLGIVSHDLRNMLTSIVAFATLIAKVVSRDSHVEEVLLHAQGIQGSAARMNRLIGDLVDVASIEAGRLAVTCEVGDPVHVATEALDSFQAQAAARGITLTAEFVSQSSVAAFDAARLLQVLTNLLSNAIKFTPAGGTVVLRVERIADELRFTVSDTGVGIPTDKLEAIFVQFVQVVKNDRRGIGLGLYISRCIVQAHGGRIWADSTPGGGSTFRFTVPVHGSTGSTSP